MSYQAVHEYIIAILDRYKNASKSKKTLLLDEAFEVTGLSRKYLIRLLKKPKEFLKQIKQTSGRSPKYDRLLLVPHLEYLWIQMERISARRMKAAYPDWLPFYRNEEPTFTPVVQLSIEAMSSATLERILRAIRSQSACSKGLTTTSPARYMKNKVPINTLDFKATQPGFTQADTVAHCGDTTEGVYANTITLTDIVSTWTDNRAIYSKKAIEVRKEFVDLDQTLPYELLAINTDSGSEFLNTQMLQFMRRDFGGKPIIFTRSRPYKKNDNCYVEQKNFTHVRELFGYERIEDPSLIDLMNDIYKNTWNPLQNYFLPTFKLTSKTRVGAKIIKKFAAPKTPYDRLMESPAVSKERKEKLKEMKKNLNPFRLKADLERKLRRFFQELKKSKIREAA